MVGGADGTISSGRALRWATNDEVPTPAQRYAALRLPWRLSLTQATLWGAAAVLFTGLAIVLQPAAILSIAFAVVIAGVVVSSVAYLISEFVLRPIAARALTDTELTRSRGLGVRGRLLIRSEERRVGKECVSRWSIRG